MRSVNVVVSVGFSVRITPELMAYGAHVGGMVTAGLPGTRQLRGMVALAVSRPCAGQSRLCRRRSREEVVAEKEEEEAVVVVGVGEEKEV